MLSAFSVTSDLASCTRCSGVRSVGLDEFRARIRGRSFGWLLGSHLRRHDEERLRRGLQGSLAVLPDGARRVALAAGEDWAEEIRGGQLAGTDCVELMDRLAERLGTAAGGPATGNVLFDAFEVATLSVVLEAREDEDLRAAIGPGETAGGYGWHLAAAVGIGTLLATTGGPVWTPILWVALGLAILPPLARLVRGRAEG